MNNETYEPPNKKLKKNKKSKNDVAEDGTFLNTNNTNEYNEESVTCIKKHKKHKKNKDLSSDIENISLDTKKEKKKKLKKFILQDGCDFVEQSLDIKNINNTDEFNESVTYSKKHKKHKKNKDLSLDITEDSSPAKKKLKKIVLQDECDFVEPLLENCVESSKFTTSNTSNQNNYKNTKVENNFNEAQLQFCENKTRKLSNKYSEHKLKEKRNYHDITETVNLPSKGRHYTVSIAVPASILKETCTSDILRTYVIGQLARAACIYSVDEIVVYNDQPLISDEDRYFIGFMKFVLEYQECPQYLRKDLAPRNRFLKHDGVLNALEAPHHLLAYQWCEYREGIVRPKVYGNCSYADIGLNSEILIDKKLEPGLRVTVKLPPESKILNKNLYGYIVSPDEPRIKNGMYWGYTVRVANCLSEVFKSDRFKSGYDLIIGTSDKGSEVNRFSFKEFSHTLILFGGVQGLEAAKEADESLSKSDIQSLCHHYVNVCPNQSSRTIRTEEAVLITLATLCPNLTIKGCTKSR